MTRTLTYQAALTQALEERMTAEPAAFIIGEDVGVAGGAFGVTVGLLDRYGPDRVIDTPISEAAFMGLGVGAAATGAKPIVEIMFADFFGVCFDTVINQAAKLRFLSAGRLSVPLTIRAVVGAGDGSAAMHSQFLHNILASIPGLRVAMPATPQDAYSVLRHAGEGRDPTIVLEDRRLYGESGPVGANLPVTCRAPVSNDADLLIVAAGATQRLALQAVDALAKDGIKAVSFDPLWINPLDSDALLAAVRATGRLLVIEEGAARFGLADHVTAVVASKAFADLKTAPAAVTSLDMPVPYAPSLEALWLPDLDMVLTSAKRMMDE